MGKSARRTIFGALFGMLVALLLVPGTALAANGHDMYRLYNQWTGEHFYTALASERDSLKGVGWTYEGVGWVAPTSGSPVYRLYNPYVKGGDHHYTMVAAERNALVKVGWRAEGTGWYSGGSVKVYRQYNPYAVTGTHNYTTSEHENGELVKVGWRAEGVGWYAVGKGGSGSSGSGSSASSGSSGSGSTNGSGSSTAAESAKYTYTAYYLDGRGDTWYTGSSRILYIKTDNPYGSFGLRDPQATQTSQVALQGGDYNDIADQGRAEYGNFTKVPGGYIAEYRFETDKPGRHTVQIIEYDKDNYFYDPGTVAGTFTINLQDYDATVNSWIDGLIKKHATSTMTPPEKMQAISHALLGEFRYLLNDDGYRVRLAQDPNTPFFISKRWDSATSPSVLCRIAERVGGFSDIHNCYGDYPYGSDGWYSSHWYCRCTYQGEDYYFEACPLTPTGQYDREDIVMINFNNVNSAQFDPA